MPVRASTNCVMRLIAADAAKIPWKTSFQGIAFYRPSFLLAACAIVISADAGLWLRHAQGRVQRDLRLGELVPVDHEQHVGLTRCL